MLIAVLRHPSGAGQVAFPRAPRPLRLARRINVQHNLGGLGPISAICLGIEETQISDEVFLVVTGQKVGVRSLVGHGWIERRPGLRHVRLCPSCEAWLGMLPRTD